jgi:hypothetical protein
MIKLAGPEDWGGDPEEERPRHAGDPTWDDKKKEAWGTEMCIPLLEKMGKLDQATLKDPITGDLYFVRILREPHVSVGIFNHKEQRSYSVTMRGDICPFGLLQYESSDEIPPREVVKSDIDKILSSEIIK